MNRSTIAASVTLGQLQHKLDSIANNLANMNTNGFKRRDVSFSELLVQQIDHLQDQTGRLTPLGIRAGHGASAASTTLRTEQGSLQDTGRMLDIALTEPAYFFQVLHNGEIEYTRDGSFYFQPSADGQFLNVGTADGALLLGANGPIQIPANYKDVSISKNGRVTVTLQNGGTIDAGQIELANVHRPQLLQSAGENRFSAPLPESGIALGDVLETVNNLEVFSQGVLETSNVDVAEEMAKLLETQRHFQLNTRSLAISDDMMGLVNKLR
ncbi:flagellar biosynthesis protein FlgG [Pueribacillus theae]|uniref:Flagellar biosynthesis protein FlgG n=1 Tax=Pueribacillus theae TaxID=2171751 RepID=A0A2U1K2W6_9BACI|nr:flagellar hook-basal body protein [Pueribacillus theae]PWA11867.1 flagellar biosynthesis protein FlgG [Pueribacillus theae]